MRKHKYRAWDKKNRIYYNECDFLSFRPGGISFMWTDYKEDEQMVTELKNGDYILLQFTGLKDKNRKEIFEGDIVKINTGYTFEVKMTKFSLGYKGSGSYGYHDYDNGEIIGNIYENENLLDNKS